MGWGDGGAFSLFLLFWIRAEPGPLGDQALPFVYFFLPCMLLETGSPSELSPALVGSEILILRQKGYYRCIGPLIFSLFAEDRCRFLGDFGSRIRRRHIVAHASGGFFWSSGRQSGITLIHARLLSILAGSEQRPTNQ